MLSGPWVADLKRAVSATGSGSDAGSAALASLALLQRAASAEAAKAAFVSTSKELGDWATAVGLAGKLKGL